VEVSFLLTCAIIIVGVVIGAVALRLKPAKAQATFIGTREELESQLGTLISCGRKIDALKLVRAGTGLGLKQSKDVVDKMAAGASLAEATNIDTPSAQTLPQELKSRVLTLISVDRKIEALKLIREATGLGLKESKDIVDSLSTAASLGGSFPTAASLGIPAALSDAALAEIDMHILAGEQIEALKKVREITHLGLKESKDLTDKLIGGAKFRQQSKLANSIDADEFSEHNMPDAIKDLILKHQKLEALKLYRQHYGCGLKEAKEQIDRLSNELGM